MRQPSIEPDRSEWPEGPDGDEAYENAIIAFDQEVNRQIDERAERDHDRWDAWERSI